MRNIFIPEVVNDPLLQMRGVGPRLRNAEIITPPRPRPIPAARRLFPAPPVPPVERPRPVLRGKLLNRAVNRITSEAQLGPLSRIRSYMPAYGMSEDAPGFWSSITGALSNTIQAAIPALATVQVAKLQANQTASLLRSQAGLYTPQNLQTLQMQGAFEAAQRANMAAAAAGSTSAPMTTGTLIAVGGLVLGGIFLLSRKK